MGNRKFINRITSLLSYLEKQLHYTEHLNQIKTSGYFSLLYINSKAMYTREISSLFIVPNEILKKVYIYNKKDKLIPQVFLIKLFEKQIGYPKNFANLNLAVSKIMTWYYDRGYQWSLVEIRQANDPSSLVINIHEGLVNTITVEYYTLSYKKICGISNTELIEQYLGVRTGVPININFLQKRINYLKDNQLVGDVIYSIERSNSDLMSLDIKFQIQELRDKEILVIAERSSKTYPIIDHTSDLLSQYSSFSDWLVTSNIISPLTSKLKACYLNRKTNSQYIYINTYSLIKILASSIYYRKTIISDYFNLLNLLTGAKKNTIGFQLYMRNLSYAKSFCIFNMKFIQNGLNMRISYLNPALRINQSFSFQVAMQIIKQYHTGTEEALSLFSNKGDFAQYLAESVFTYHFTSYFSLSEKILLSRDIYTDSRFYNSEHLSFYNNSKNGAISNYDIFKQNKKLLYQEFLALLLSIRYQDFSYVDWPLKGHLLELKSFYFTPLQKSGFLLYSLLDNYKKLFSHRIYFKQVSCCNLPLYFRKHFNHILIITMKCQSNLNIDTIYLLLSSRPAETTLYKSILNFSLKVRMEYLVPISRSLRISVFYNYLDCLSMRPLKRLAYIWQDLKSYKQVQYFLLEKFSCGFGIQLKLPIRQMPLLSIEYTVNSGRNFCIYLHIYY
uniref:Uncharacterized protein n=1 Tax=Pyropia pulchra TaxID=60925 RepID=A0A141SFC7_9RHOD|nr:hypothetical protein Ppul_168 [Pyropia pulchra]AMK96995.1 hypothetical protein Ppul_168 [Pyropia pulchra]